MFNRYIFAWTIMYLHQHLRIYTTPKIFGFSYNLVISKELCCPLLTFSYLLQTCIVHTRASQSLKEIKKIFALFFLFSLKRKKTLIFCHLRKKVSFMKTAKTTTTTPLERKLNLEDFFLLLTFDGFFCAKETIFSSSYFIFQWESFPSQLKCICNNIQFCW